VLCEHCEGSILFGLDPGDGSGPTSQPLKLVLTGSEPGCRRRADDSGAMGLRYQKSDADSPLQQLSHL